MELATYPEEPETPQPKYSRDYYVKASRSPTGEPPPRFSDSPVSLRSETSLEVSRIMNPTPLFPHSVRDYEDLHESVSDNTFSTFKRRTKSNLHYSKVFQTSLPAKQCTFDYGHHSLRLPSKHKRSMPRQETSAFRRYDDDLKGIEQNVLFRDIRHLSFRARDASPNFILNPVFELEPARKLEEKYSSAEAISSGCDEVGEPTFRSLSRSRVRRRDRESGYGSTESVDSWRLTLPRTPELTETTFEPIPRQRRPRSCLGLSSQFSHSKSDIFFL